MDFDKIAQRLSEISGETAKFILEAVSQFEEADIEVKSENNFVTWVDKKSEEMLVTRLMELIPGSGFIVEEKTKPDQISEFTWIIDPLDGTTNFIHRLPLFCISISLMKDAKQVVGLVHEVVKDEVFSAILGGGAFLNGKRIHVSRTPSVKESLLATGFPYYDYNRLDPFMEIFRHLMQHSHGIRRLGSAAADLAYVACGRFDGFYEYGLSPWDVAAGSLLVTEAGGKVSDFSGTEDYLFGREILACNGEVFTEMLQLLKRYFLNR